ncbi:MAG: BTAD domain-containing putative transcriptional regulator [Caldilineaceae bacterium]
MFIRTFGALSIARGDKPEPLRFAAHTVEALLVYLACQDRPLGRDELAELLWPERTQEQARVNLRGAIYRLRGQIEPYLLVSRQNLALNPNADIDLDARQFERQLAAGELATAVALYRGDFLAGFYLDGSPAFEQWALLERERLRNLVLSAYGRLVDQAATAGQLDAAIAYAQRLLQLDALHEPTHRQLMRLLTQTGQRSAALAQYEICRKLLLSELGVAPDEMTTMLYERILTHGQDSEAVDGATCIKLPAKLPADYHQDATLPNTRLHNLPRQPTPLIGRSAELAQIASLLSNPDCRLLTLVGVGGIGKTRLAIEAGQRKLEAAVGATHRLESQIQALQFPDGICFVALAPVEKAERVLATIAQSLDLKIISSNPQAELAAYLQARRMLLILDNFEHVTEAAVPIAHLLQDAPNIKIVVTSRERLCLREEWLLPIAGLALGEGLAGEAGQLFLRSAQRVQPAFTGREQEPAIAAICEQVEGMPLAVELAASWVRVMSCAEIARQIGKDIDVFTTTLRNLPERHRSLHSLFDQSWRLLSPVEQGVLRRVSVFRGGWSLDEAAVVAGATFTLLVGLVDKSLVRTNGEGRFDLHELVRQYAAEQLIASGEVDLTRQRHYEAYLQLFRTGDVHLRGPESATWLARLQPELNNLRAALHWTFAKARYTDMAWLLIAPGFLWYLAGQRYEEATWSTLLMPHRQALAVDLRLAFMIGFIDSAVDTDESPSLDPYIAEIHELMEICPGKHLHAIAWNYLSWYTSDVKQTAAALDQAVACARLAADASPLGSEFGGRADHDFALGVNLCTYANLLMNQGQAAEATTLITEGLQLFRRRGNQPYLGECLSILGFLAFLRNDTATARRHWQEAVAIGKMHNLPMLLCECQPLLGIVTLYTGDLHEAKALLKHSLLVCRQVKSRPYLAQVYTCLAETALWEEDWEQAAQWLAQAVANRSFPTHMIIGELFRLFAGVRVAAAQGHYKRAATLAGVTDAVQRQANNVYAGPALPLVDAAVAQARAALGPAVFAEAFAAGQQMSLEEAFAVILAPGL